MIEKWLDFKSSCEKRGIVLYHPWMARSHPIKAVNTNGAVSLNTVPFVNNCGIGIIYGLYVSSNFYIGHPKYDKNSLAELSDVCITIGKFCARISGNGLLIYSVNNKQPEIEESLKRNEFTPGEWVRNPNHETFIRIYQADVSKLNTEGLKEI